MPKTRVLIVDDSAFIRRSIIRMLDGNPYIQVIDVASDGQMAVQKVRELRPDVVTLDIRMPVMDGLTALRIIMKECPTPVIMLSSLTGKGDEETLKALDLGAVDFIDKTASGGGMDFSLLAAELSAKILVASRVDVAKLSLQGEEVKVRHELPYGAGGRSDIEVVAIGTSTGGPPALQAVLPQFPEDFPCPILIVQHMAPGFTRSLAERLDKSCRIRVKEAEDNEEPKPGCAYIAPAGMHLKLARRGGLRLRVEEDPTDTLHKPSVDVLFSSVSATSGKRAVVAVLTGMGRDGAMGAAEVKCSGGKVVVESEETAVVYGMPKAVAEMVKVDAVAPLPAIAETLINLVLA